MATWKVVSRFEPNHLRFPLTEIRAMTVMDGNNGEGNCEVVNRNVVFLRTKCQANRRFGQGWVHRKNDGDIFLNWNVQNVTALSTLLHNSVSRMKWMHICIRKIKQRRYSKNNNKIIKRIANNTYVLIPILLCPLEFKYSITM